MENKNKKYLHLKNLCSLFSLTVLLLLAPALYAQTYPETDGFTLPEGKTIVITYEVEVQSDPCPGGEQNPLHLSNQAAISGDNFTDVLTYFEDDQDPDPTLFPLAINTDCYPESRVFVDGAGEGFQDGTGWNASFIDLQFALEVGCGNAFEIWVAQGTYFPDGGTGDRNRTFQLCNNMEVYGGFAGTENDLFERDWTNHSTILSGDINATGTLTGNSYSVVTGSDTDQTAVFDGFTVTMGNADEETGDSGAPERSGGGMFMTNGNPQIANTVFVNNSANQWGGGMYNESSSPTLVNTLLSSNAATSGGGIYNAGGSSATLTNVTISGNTGGGVYNTDSSPALANAIVWGNTGGQVINAGTSAPQVGYSLVEGGCPSGASCQGTLLDTDPLFTNAGASDYSLQSESPAVEAGDPDTELNLFPVDELGNPVDLAGAARFQGAAIDMGAFESSGLSILLTGIEGFRMLSSPVEVNLTDFLAPIWTQGLENADFEGGDPNVWIWDNSSTGGNVENWNVLENLDTTLGAGNGVMVYVFANDVFGESGQFPKTLSVSGSPHSLPFSPQINPNPESFTMVGNPTVSSIAWNDMDKTDLDDVIYVWDPNEGEGEWQASDGTVGDLTDGVVRPFQSFLTVTSAAAASPSLEISKTTTPGEFFGKGIPGQEPYALRLQLEGEGLQSSTWLRFSEHGEFNRYKGDGYALQPLAPDYALLATRKQDDALLSINHLPVALESPLHTPLTIGATRSGSFTLQATQINLPDQWDAFVYDSQTGREFSIEKNKEFIIELEKSENTAFRIKDNRTTPELVFADLKYKAGPEEARFTLIITPEKGTVTEIPDAVGLRQNYPNPFNPVTIIEYQLPANSVVRLEVFDMVGRSVATLVDGQVPAGTHQVAFDASDLSSGVYLYRMNAGGQVITRKLTLIK